MSAIAGLVPKIEGFQPIPNAVMIPFMEVQSAALAYGFGLNYEYSKRKIRSMSNEQFNSTTPEDIEQMQAAHTKVLLNGFIKRVATVMPAQIEIFKQYVEIEKAKVLQNVELAKWIATNAPSIIVTGETAGTNIIKDPTASPVVTRTPSRGTVTSPSTITTHMTIYIWTTVLVTETKMRLFFKRAYPSATITNYRYAGSIVTKNEGKGTKKQTVLITYTNAFPLPKTLELTHNNYENI